MSAEILHLPHQPPRQAAGPDLTENCEVVSLEVRHKTPKLRRVAFGVHFIGESAAHAPAGHTVI